LVRSERFWIYREEEKTLMKLKLKWYIRILVVLTIGIVTGSTYAFSENVQKDRPAKDFSLKDMQSKKVSLSDFRGKVVLLNFFATWCPPCRQEIPELVKIYQQNKKKGLVILGVSLDAAEASFVLKNFVRIMKIPYPILIGTEEVAEDYRISGVPITLIINKEGKIVKRFEGLVPPRYFENALKDLLETRS
jgi:peroxiredoxin